MKNLRFIALILLTVTLFSSCNQTITPDEETSTTDIVDVTTTEKAEESTTAEEEVPVAPTVIKLIENGSSVYSIIRKDEPGDSVVKLCTQFRDELKIRTACEFMLKSDLLPRNTSEDPEAKELVIGDTNRAISSKLKKAVNKAGANRFGIAVSGNKIGVYGADEYTMFLGLSYLMDNFIKNENDSINFELLDGYEYISDTQNVDLITDFAEAERSGRKLAFYASEKIARVPTNGTHTVMQGGGTDGKYAYYSVIDKTALTAVIYKFDINTWEIVKTSKPLPTAHNNDITYDSVNNRLVISYCADTYLKLCFVDPDTLEFIGEINGPVAQRAVEYLPATNQYLLGTNYYYTLTDDKFNKISSFDDGWPKYTTQGMCCDEKYVYDVRWISSTPTQQYIVVHGLDGTCYGEISFTGMSGEPENIFRRGNDFYIGCNKVLLVYKVKLLPEKWWVSTNENA